MAGSEAMFPDFYPAIELRASWWMRLRLLFVRAARLRDDNVTLTVKFHRGVVMSQFDSGRRA